MFATAVSRWTARLARAIALVKAFALLEDAPRSAPARACPSPPRDAGPRTTADTAPHVVHAHEQRTHPHRLPLAAAPRTRRPGAPPRPVQPCTMPVVNPLAPKRTARV
jgi:hypothetical protein